MRESTIHITVTDQEVVYEIDEDRLAKDLEVLPDFSRRSRHSKMCPIAIPTVVDGKEKTNEFSTFRGIRKFSFWR